SASPQVSTIRTRGSEPSGRSPISPNTRISVGRSPCSNWTKTIRDSVAAARPQARHGPVSVCYRFLEGQDDDVEKHATEGAHAHDRLRLPADARLGAKRRTAEDRGVPIRIPGVR